MKVERLTENCYRIRKTINKKTIAITFDHKPTDVEIAKALADKLNIIDTKDVKQSFEVASTEYIALKDKILSPSTIRSYKTIVKQLSDAFKSKNIQDITQVDIQLEINNLSVSKTPKTISNIHGFISAVLGTFRPGFIINTTLPQKVKYEPYTPSDDDIKKIIEMVKGTKYSIPFQLGILGLRRSEICALLPSDIEGNYISICKAKVEGENGFTIKNLTKTTEGKRKVYIPDSLVNEIKENDCVFDGFPSMLVNRLHSCQRELKLNKFRFHDLRAFYCSYAHSCGIPDSIIMANGGWKSDYTMKKIYRRAIQDDIEYYQKALAKDLLG